MSWRYLSKTSWRRLGKTSWRCLEDVLKTHGQDEYIGLDQDVFWRCMAKANMFVLIKTSWSGLEDVFWRRRQKTFSRRLQDVFIKTNVWWVDTFQNSHIRFAVTEPTHNRSSFYQRSHRKFGWRFDTANTNCQNCVKNAFKITKLHFKILILDLLLRSLLTTDYPFTKGITGSLACSLVQQILIAQTMLKMLSKLQNYKVWPKKYE